MADSEDEVDLNRMRTRAWAHAQSIDYGIDESGDEQGDNGDDRDEPEMADLSRSPSATQARNAQWEGPTADTNHRAQASITMTMPVEGPTSHEPSHQTNAATILDAASKCNTLFQQQLEQLISVSITTYALLEDQYGRYNIWCASIGVFAKGQASMDYRLREAEDIRDLVIRLLITLKSHIELMLTTVIDNRPQEHEGSKRHENNTDIDQTLHDSKNLLEQQLSSLDRILQAISKDITLLHKLSNTIRQASSESVNRKAETTFIWQEDGLDDPASCFRDHFAATLVDLKCPNASYQIKARLASAMLLRRQRFLYRQYRYRKTPIKLPRFKARRHLHDLTLPSTRPVVSANVNEPTAVSDSQDVPSIINSRAPTATTLNVQRFRKITAPSHVSIPASKSISPEIKDHFPPIPKPRNGADTVCPYCFLVLIEGETKSTKAWNEHVKSDLDAYVCVFEDCDEPNTLYKHSKDWLKHIHQRHRMEWRCRSRAHKPATFSTRADYEYHMYQHHAGTFSKQQLSLLADESASPMAVTFPHCPLCGLQDTNVAMDAHVASHLRYLALKCLPWTDDVDESGLSDSSSAPRKSRSTIAEEMARGESGSSSSGDDLPPDSRILQAFQAIPLGKLSFACPYYKHDPLRYSYKNPYEERYMGCRGGAFPDIPRVKSHLRRIHWRPLNSCSRCWHDFGNLHDLAEHSKRDEACISKTCPYPEKMDKRQRDIIHVKRPLSRQFEQWYDIWNVLFPDSLPPSSPYKDQQDSSTDKQHTSLARPGSSHETELNQGHSVDGEDTAAATESEAPQRQQQRVPDKLNEDDVVVVADAGGALTDVTTYNLGANEPRIVETLLGPMLDNPRLWDDAPPPTPLPTHDWNEPKNRLSSKGINWYEPEPRRRQKGYPPNK